MRFRPSVPATLMLGLLAGLFAWLGAWQWQRADAKETLWARFATAPMLTELPAQPDPDAFTRITLQGRFDSRRHFFADNKLFRGRPGVHVLTPFTTSTGDATVLVNRGWLPLPLDRGDLPEVPVHPGLLLISGHLEPLRGGGPMLGGADVLRSDTWPQLVTYPDAGAFAAALGTELYPLTLYQDADSPGGFADRQWNPFVMGPDKHRGYAATWFALSVTAILAWGMLGRNRGRQDSP